MRAGGYTVHQSLTAEVAAVLKLALGLARSRGHSQVTPLHVAFTLLGCSSSAAAWASSSPPPASPCAAYGLLRRACAKAHPGGTGAVSSSSRQQQARCRALELCFNVALNRLPATNACSPLSSSPSSSSSSGASSTAFAASLVLQSSPTLSNALVAALKRAQASQRRGCVELQSQQPPPTQQQQQPLLTIKVELDQLIVSILDDPSVSRVMREAGFSSAAIKTSLEDESATATLLLGPSHHSSSSTSPPSSHSPTHPAAAVPTQCFHDLRVGLPTHAGCSNGGMFWPAHHPDAELESSPSPCKEDDDVSAILEVMSSSWKQQGSRRSNPVVVGDSTSAAEGSVAKLMRRLEIGGDDVVPDELRGGVHVLRLHLSHVHVRLMTRADVDAWETDLRRTVAACTTNAAALIIYVGDVRWAVDDDAAVRGYSPAEHMAAALATLLRELRTARGRAWLVAAASYRTYMRCRQQRGTLEAMWALQPVPVPAGAGVGLGLGLAVGGPRAARHRNSSAAFQPEWHGALQHNPKEGRLAQFPLLEYSEPKQEDGVSALCVECARNLESEASAARAKARSTDLALSCFPGWPQADEPDTTDDLLELKKKWSMLCQRLHRRYCRQQPAPARPSISKSIHPAGLCLSLETPTTCPGRPTQGKKIYQRDDVGTTLSLLLPDSAAETSNSRQVHRRRGREEDDLLLGSKPKMQQPDLVVVQSSNGDLKRNAETRGLPPSESKRWRRRGSRGLDLNLCAEEEEEEEEVSIGGTSDLTNDVNGGGREGSSRDVTDSLDSHS